MPWWYPPIVQARYLGCHPWDIDETPCTRYLWGVIAGYARNAEITAAKSRR